MMNIVSISYKDYKAEIDLDNGANCISLKNSEYNASILREYDEKIGSPYLYGMPVLFPANRIENGIFEFEGRKYKLPVNEEKTNCFLHGDLCQRRFDILKKTENSIECIYTANSKNPYYEFLNEFEIKLEYILSDDGLAQNTKIKNLSHFSMPVLLGFHTTFNIPFSKGTKAEDILVFADVESVIERDENYLPTGKINEFDEDIDLLNMGRFVSANSAISKYCFAKNDGKMVLYDKINNLSVIYSNDKKFAYRLIFNGGRKDFICLEPQTNFVNCFSAKMPDGVKGFDVIEPNREKGYKSSICIKQGDFR